MYVVRKIHIQCPQCLNEMTISSRAQGEVRRCSVCGCRFEVPYDNPEAPEETVAAYRTRLMARWDTALRVSGWVSLALGVALILPGVADAVHLWILFLFSALAGLALIGIQQSLQGTILSVCSILFYSLLVVTIPDKSFLERRLVIRSAASRAKDASPTATPAGRAAVVTPTPRVLSPTPAAAAVPAAVITPAAGPVASAAAARPVAVKSTPAPGPKPVAVNRGAEVRPAEIVQSGPPTQGFVLQADTDWEMNEGGQFVPDMPFVLYSDCYSPMPFSPFGWMGNVISATQDDRWKQNPCLGATCIRVTYTDAVASVGCAWHAPLNNRGQNPAKFDLSKAGCLTLWARGEVGDEVVEFKIGVPTIGAKFQDSVWVSSGKISLTPVWTQYRIDLRDLDLSHIINGFVWSVDGVENGVTFYMDEIQYEALNPL